MILLSSIKAKPVLAAAVRLSNLESILAARIEEWVRRGARLFCQILAEAEAKLAIEAGAKDQDRQDLGKAVR